MSKTFGYAICDNKITQILYGSKAVWYDDVGNRRVEDVKYIEADDWEQAKESIRQRESGVVVSKTETTTKDSLVVGNAAALREALLAMVDAETGGTFDRDDICGRCLEKMFGRCKHDGTCWVDKVMSALSSPARNCERYTTLDSALAAWREESPSVGPFDNWLFDYAQESEVTK